MKILRIISKTIFFLCLTCSIALFGGLFYLNESLSGAYKIKRGSTLDISSPLPVTAVYNGTPLSKTDTNVDSGKFNVSLKMFGIIPLREASVEVVSEMQVAVLGQPFGMRLYTRGVLVVEISKIATANGNKSPASDSGLKVGDYIITVNGKKISTNEDLVALVEGSSGSELEFKILRGKIYKTLKIKGELCSESNTYKIGVWVRDSSAGIGTLTFYSPALNIVCGLGHGICDEDTGELLKIESGEIASADIFDVERGTAGNPGKLLGKISTDSLGEIVLNSAGGVYSELTGEIKTELLTEIALKSEVENGDAQIICTLEGDTPQSYSCKIALKSGGFSTPTQNLVVTVTDQRLLDKTGGIVQGLSGSPIIQNGKLVGAVTHVLVDDPTKGYGIFAENMLENAKSVTELKEAG